MKHLNLVMFPPELVELSKEVSYHPQLIELINTQPTNEWEMRLAHIATYCEVILDGTYDHDGIVGLAKILTKKLVEKRSKLILM